MQMIIDIPDEWKERIEHNRRPNTIECGELVESIWKGKMIPKGHGRLIDADALKKHKYHDNNRFENAVAVAQIDWADTIIEADKAESEDK